MIYLDNSATTRVSDAAAEKMLYAARECWGNPSSLHEFGLSAERLLSEARANVMSALGAKSREHTLVFTSSGTEANNLALFGVANAKKRPVKKRIITDNSQHASVMRPLERLEEQGIEIVYVSTKGGRLDTDEIVDAIDENTIMLSLMLVNNETGAIYDVASAFSKAKRKNPNIVTHTDAIQGFKKIPFTVKSLSADLISVSGHKLHAPKGIGALLISNDVIKAKKIIPVTLGGGQEGNWRSGTESVPLAAAFGEAVKEDFNAANAASMRQRIIDALPESIRANVPHTPAPHILSLTLPHIKSETMLHFLSARGIYVSSGSACSSHGHASGALESFGIESKEADCTIRVSLSGEESDDEIDTFIAALAEGVDSLIRIK